MESLVQSKSLKFAVRIYKLCRDLSDDKREHILAKQLLRSGTSVGANLREAQYAQSGNDFISKNSIALKEIAETEYWLELLHETQLLSDKEYQSIQNDCSELARLLIAIVKTAKQNNN